MTAITHVKTCGINVLSLVALSLAWPATAQNPVNLPELVGPTYTADPLSVADKFDYRVMETLGYRGYAGSLIGAAIGQARNVPHEWGQGVKGYATRFASGYGTNLSRKAMEFALESSLHQDPRYFPSVERSFKQRIRNVVLQTVVARTDSGKESFAWARIGSAFAAGELANTWQPHSVGSPSDGLMRGCIALGGDLAFNFLQEFIPWIRPHGLHR